MPIRRSEAIRCCCPRAVVAVAQVHWRFPAVPLEAEGPRSPFEGGQDPGLGETGRRSVVPRWRAALAPPPTRGRAQRAPSHFRWLREKHPSTPQGCRRTALALRAGTSGCERACRSRDPAPLVPPCGSGRPPRPPSKSAWLRRGRKRAGRSRTRSGFGRRARTRPGKRR